MTSAPSKSPGSPLSRPGALAVLLLLLVGGALAVFKFWKPALDEETAWDEPRRLLRTGKLDECLRLTEELLGRAPASREGRRIAAEASVRLGRIDQALAHLDAAAQTSEQRIELQFSAAKLAYEHGRLRDAEHRLEEVLEAQPEHEPARRELASLLLTVGRHWEATSHLFWLVSRANFRVDELVMLGSVEELLEDSPLLAKARETSPDDPGAPLGQGKLHAFWERYDSGIADLETAIRLDPQEPEGWAGLGRTLLAAQRWEELAAWESRAPETARAHPDVAYVLGCLAEQRGDLRAAVRAWSQALDVHPNHRQACYRLGQTLSTRGLRDASARFLERARMLDEFERVIHRVLFQEKTRATTTLASQLAEDLGRPTEAWGWAVTAAADFPTETALAREVQRLRPAGRNAPAQTLAEVRDRLKFDPAWIEALPEATTPGADSSEPSAGSARTLSFVDDAARVGLSYEFDGGFGDEPRGLWIYQNFGPGVAVLDYDGDGRPDLFFTQQGVLPATRQHPQRPHELHRLERDRYAPRHREARLGVHGFGQGAAVGDADDDGFPDIYAAQIGANVLLVNWGDGTFDDRSTSLPPDAAWTSSCAMADLDGDGVDDLFDANYLAGRRPFEHVCRSGSPPVVRSCKPDLFEAAEDRLLLNDGAGGFRDATAASGVLAPDGKGLGVLVADFDQSGGLDAFVANDTSPNFLFMNQGGKDGGPLLAEEGVFRGAAFNRDGRVEACMGIAAGDSDGDGRIDLFVTNFYDETNTLYRWGAEERFDDRTLDAGVDVGSKAQLGFGVQFLDADLDGWSDLVLLNGHIDDYSHMNNIPWKMRPQAYVNQGAGKFLEAPSGGLGPYFTAPQLGRALARLDWNLDGRDDLIAMHLDRNPALLTNTTTPAGGGVGVRLTGRRSSRTATGAIVRARAAGREQTHFACAGDGFFASNERQLTIGVGTDAAAIDVSVAWPSGDVEHFGDLPAGGDYVLVEGASRAWRLP